MSATTDAVPSVSQGFIGHLDGLVRRNDRARLAALRQLVAPPDRWGPEAYAAGMPLLPPSLRPFDEERWLMVAGLYALWHQGHSTPAPHSGTDFGESMKTLARNLSGSSELAPAVERRFSVLLASDDERLKHYLRQAVRQLASSDVKVDFVRLLDDLRYWNHPDRYIQRRWARAFWAPTRPVEQEESE
jgi:CRISPR system Cascade subunit CasB